VGTTVQTVQRKKAFLAAYAVTGIITHACEASGVPRQTMYDWQEHDDEFAAAFVQAQLASTEVMEAEAYRRAVEGTEAPVVRAGKIIGSAVHYSDNLLMFLLKGRHPEKYRDNSKVEHTGTIDMGTIGELLQGHDARQR
jgi:hypothetical protein